MVQQHMEEQVQNKQDDDQLNNIPDNDIQIGYRQYFNEYELIQDEDLRKFDMTDNIVKSPPTRKLR